MSKQKNYKILTINPGSTSTKIGVFENETCSLEINLTHSSKELESYSGIWEQYTFRKNEIIIALENKGFKPADFDSVVGRGGLIKPIPSGVYFVDQQMIEDARSGFQGHHASNLGCVIAYSIGWEFDIPAFIVDPPAVNDFEPVAKISGHKDFERGSLFHALNIFATGREYAKTVKKKFENLNLIVAHMGGGITVAALKNGKAINVNNGLDEGPFTPERSGQLPMFQFMKHCLSGKYTETELKKMIAGKGGLTSYFNTNKAKDIEGLVAGGSQKHKLVYDAMAYQIAEEIGRRATNLKGKVDAIILTGGIAHSKLMTGMISERASFIAPVEIFAGESELEALAAGGLRVLRGEENAKHYTKTIKRVGIIYWDNIDVYTSAIETIEAFFKKSDYVFRKEENNMHISYVNCKNEEDKVLQGIQKFREGKYDLIIAIGSPVSMRMGQYMKKDTIPVIFTGIYSAAIISDFFQEHNNNFHAACYAIPVKEVLAQTVFKISPNIKTIGILYRRSELQSEIQLDELKEVGKQKNINILSYEVDGPADFAKAKAYFKTNNVEWIFMGTSMSVAGSTPEELSVFTAEFPTVCLLEDTVSDGGAISYAIPWEEICTDAAQLAVQIFNGEKINQNVVIPHKKQVIINKKTVKLLKLTEKIESLKNVKII